MINFYKIENEIKFVTYKRVKYCWEGTPKVNINIGTSDRKCISMNVIEKEKKIAKPSFH